MVQHKSGPVGMQGEAANRASWLTELFVSVLVWYSINVNIVSNSFCLPTRYQRPVQSKREVRGPQNDVHIDAVSSVQECEIKQGKGKFK